MIRESTAIAIAAAAGITGESASAIPASRATSPPGRTKATSERAASHRERPNDEMRSSTPTG